MARYRVSFEFETEGNSAREAALSALSDLQEGGYSPTAGVTELDENGEEVGEEIWIDTESRDEG